MFQLRKRYIERLSLDSAMTASVHILGCMVTKLIRLSFEWCNIIVRIAEKKKKRERQRTLKHFTKGAFPDSSENEPLVCDNHISAVGAHIRANTVEGAGNDPELRCHMTILTFMRRRRREWAAVG